MTFSTHFGGHDYYISRRDSSSVIDQLSTVSIVLNIQSLIPIQAEMSSKIKDNITEVGTLYYDRWPRSSFVIYSRIKGKDYNVGFHAMSFANGYHVKVAVKCFIIRQLHALFAFWHIHSWIKIIMTLILIRNLTTKKGIEMTHKRSVENCFFFLKMAYDESLYEDIWPW